MNCLRRQKGKYNYLIIFALVSFFLTVDVGISPRVCVFAEDNQSIYPDKAGREALRLWTERERDRSRAEAARRYWDYWLYHPSNYYSAYPKHYPLPLPPPVPPYPWIYGYPYPFPSYLYPPTAYWMPPYYGPPPWFSYPYPYPYKHHLKPHRGKKKKKK